MTTEASSARLPAVSPENLRELWQGLLQRATYYQECARRSDLYYSDERDVFWLRLKTAKDCLSMLHDSVSDADKACEAECTHLDGGLGEELVSTLVGMIDSHVAHANAKTRDRRPRPSGNIEARGLEEFKAMLLEATGKK